MSKITVSVYNIWLLLYLLDKIYYRRTRRSWLKKLNLPAPHCGILFKTKHCPNFERWHSIFIIAWSLRNSLVCIGWLTFSFKHWKHHYEIWNLTNQIPWIQSWQMDLPIIVHYWISWWHFLMSLQHMKFSHWC